MNMERQRNCGWKTGAVFTLAFGVGLLVWPLKSSARTSSSSIVVLPYNGTGDKTKNKGDEVAEKVSAAIAESGYRVIDQGAAQRAASLVSSKMLHESFSDSIAKIAQSTGAEIVITGEFLNNEDKEQWLFISQITNAKTGESLASRYVYPLHVDYQNALPLVGTKIVDLFQQQMSFFAPGKSQSDIAAPPPQITSSAEAVSAAAPIVPAESPPAPAPEPQVESVAPPPDQTAAPVESPSQNTEASAPAGTSQ